jgi:methyl-accepting chemotaxis protein
MICFQNLSARVRLILGFVAVSVLLSGVAVLALYQMNLINQSVEKLVDRDVTGIQAAYEADLLIGHMRRVIRDTLIATKTDAIRAGKVEVAKTGAAFEEACKKVEPTLITVEGKAALAQIREAYPGYIAGCQEIVDLAAQGKRDEGMEYLNKRTTVVGAKMADGLRKMCDIKMDVTNRTGRECTETYQRSKFTTIVAITVCAMLSLLLGWVLAGYFAKGLAKAVEVLERMANGDFTKKMVVTSTDEMGRMGRAMNAAVDAIKAALQDTRTVADTVAVASQQLSAASEEISTGAQEQASSLEETASSLEEITSTVRQNADNAQQANQLALGARQVAEKGGSVVGQAVKGMAEINEASKKIAEIITAIDEIAFQTNLLALNAAVEAARAGEQGRGFAVVAGEVRNLAQRSASAAKEIKGLIQDTVRKVEAGTELVNQSGKSLDDIVNSVKRVTDIVSEIAAASREQTGGIEQVNKAVMQMDQVTQANASQTEELSGTAEGLASQAAQLQELVARFKLDVSAHSPAAMTRGITVFSARTATTPGTKKGVEKKARATSVVAPETATISHSDTPAQPSLPDMEMVGAGCSNGDGAFEEF